MTQKFIEMQRDASELLRNKCKMIEDGSISWILSKVANMITWSTIQIN